MDDLPEAAVFDDVYRRFVYMTLYARMGDGTWSNNEELFAFTVQFGEPTLVCINDEPYAYHSAKSVRSFAEGETIDFADVTAERVPKPATLTPPYFSARRTPAGWRVNFDFSRPSAQARELLDVGDEFLTSATAALAAGALRAFIENAFHASESYARAEMLSYPIVSDELAVSNKHSRVQGAYDLWARLGNTDGRFPRLLRTLQESRGPATYADSDFHPDTSRAADQLAVINEQRAVARAAVAGEPRQINVIATREIRAGTVVSTSDATIRPAPKRR